MHKPRLSLVYRLSLSISTIGLLFACGEGSDGSNESANQAVESYTLQWEAPTYNDDGSEFTDLTGFKLYYGDNEQQLQHTLILLNPQQRSYTFMHSELHSDTTYYFAVAALNSWGDESELSAYDSVSVE